MSENNDFIQLPPLKKDTPYDVVAFIWAYMKVPEDSREKVKNLLKDANENGVKLSHQAPTLYDVVPKEEITEFEEQIMMGQEKSLAHFALKWICNQLMEWLKRRIIFPSSAV